MKTTKAELLQKIIEKQKELIDCLYGGYGTDMIVVWEDVQKERVESELAGLNAQLEQSTPKSTIDRADFFEKKIPDEPKQEDDEFGPIDLTNAEPDKLNFRKSQIDKKTLRKELIKFQIWCEDGSQIPSDIKYCESVVNDYLKSKE